MAVCKQVYYSGQVQGVGFRYTARQLAEGYDVAGYVRNLPSGQVELVAEGPAEHVEAFLTAVARHMAGYIERTYARDEPCGGHQGFVIRH
jgi:acylphosphatase